MKTLKQIERLQRLHEKIMTEHTGTPTCLAKELGISRSTLYEMLGYLKDVGADIAYSCLKKSFYYQKTVTLQVIISIKVLNEKESRNLFGGLFF